jgi:hypothetical protein
MPESKDERIQATQFIPIFFYVYLPKLGTARLSVSCLFFAGLRLAIP